MDLAGQKGAAANWAAAQLYVRLNEVETRRVAAVSDPQGAAA
jgi:hypothetical protein